MNKRRHHSPIKKQSVNLRLILFCSVVFNCKKLSALYEWLSSIDGYIPFVVISLSLSLSLSPFHSFSIAPTLSLFQFNWQPPRIFSPHNIPCFFFMHCLFLFDVFLLDLTANKVCAICEYLPRLSTVSFWLLGFSSMLYAYRYAMGGVSLSWRYHGQSQSEHFKGVF